MTCTRMKLIGSIFLWLAFSPVLAQENKELKKIQNSVSYSTETGSGIAFVDDYWKSFNEQFEIPKSINLGFTLSYCRFLQIKRSMSISFGLGFNATIFDRNVIFSNVPKTGNLTPSPYEIGRSKHYYLSFDLPFRYYFNIRLGDNLKISPYIGVKLRNVIYIGDEERNVVVG